MLTASRVKADADKSQIKNRESGSMDQVMTTYEGGRLLYQTDADDEGLSVGQILKRRMHLTEHQIRRAKFRTEGILCDGVQVRVTVKPAAGSHIAVRIEDDIDKKVFPDEPEAFLSAEISERTVMTEGPYRKLRILYEDEILLAVDKPAGMPVHRGRGHYGDTLADRVCDYLHISESGVHIVGRLDRDTSGIVVFAKNAVAAQRLSEQPRDVHYKRYLALVRGCPSFVRDCPSGSYETGTWETVEFPIRKAPGALNRMEVLKQADRVDRLGSAECFEQADRLVRKEQSERVYMADPTSKPVDEHAEDWQQAITRYRVLGSKQLGRDQVSLVEAVPITGRTHQIRVHMAALGCPLPGDPIYDKSSIYDKPSIYDKAAIHDKAAIYDAPIIYDEDLIYGRGCIHQDFAQENRSIMIGMQGSGNRSMTLSTSRSMNSRVDNNVMNSCMYLRCTEAHLLHPFTEEPIIIRVTDQQAEM